MGDNSPSVSWRLEGNTLLKTVTDSLAPALMESRLLEVLQKYYRAAETAQNKTEKSSAGKNYAIAAWKLAQFYKGKRKDDDLMAHYFMECFKYLTVALRSGVNAQSLEWQRALKTKARDYSAECLDNLMTSCKGESRGRIIEKLIPHFCLPECQIEAHMQLVKTYFDLSVTVLEDKKYKGALYFLKECYHPIEELRRLGSADTVVLAEVEILAEDVVAQTCVAESVRARATGDELAVTAVRDYETLPIGLMWDIADWYRQAIVLIREKDVEQEAIAFSRLGSLYHGLLKMKHKARECFSRSVQLAHTVPHKSFTSESWYKEAAQTLEKYQQESVQTEQKKEQEQRAEILKQLKDTIEKLQGELQKGDSSFLGYVYKQHKPLNERHVLMDGYKENLKKAFQLAVVHYHPDKVDLEKHGRKQHVLFGEITKLLTSRYEYFKGAAE